MDYYRLVLKRFLTLWVVGVVLAGCGSSGIDFVTADGSSTGAMNPQLFGRALLDRPANGATAELTDLSGNPLGFQAKVDETGNFRIPVVRDALPEEFRVRVLLHSDSDWDLPIIANHRIGEQAAYPNILTTAAALYRERNSVSQAEAESWVRLTFNIPDDAHIGWGVDESTRSDFRHSTFLAQALANGGVSSFLNARLDNREVVGQSIEDADEPSIPSQVGASIIANIGADAILDASSALLGLIGQSLGLNIGNSTSVQDVSNQLSEIQNDIGDLERQLAADFEVLSKLSEAQSLINSYLTLTTSLQPVLTGIQAQTENLVTVSASADITNAPFNPDQAVEDLLAGLASYGAEADLDQMETALLGRNQTASLLRLYSQLVAINVGVPPIDPAGSTPVAWANTPVLTNLLIQDAIYPIVEFYGQQQILALNLVVENANASLNQATVEDARETAADFQVALAEQLQYARLALPSDLYFANPGAAYESGTETPKNATIYYSQLQAKTAAYRDIGYRQSGPALYTVYSDGAQQFRTECASFQAPAYGSGWQLTTLNQLRQLRALALQADPNSAVGGLTKLGFTLTSDFEDNPYLWYYDPNSSDINGTVYTEGQNLTIQIRENDPVKRFDFATGDTYGYNPPDMADLFRSEYAYLELRPQNFNGDSTPFKKVVACGLRPAKPPELTLTSDEKGPKITAEFNTDIVNEYCVWQSSNFRQLEVRSLGEDSGRLIWHPSDEPLTAQTITVSYQGMDADTGQVKTLQSTITVQPPDPAPTRTLTGILLSPSNSILLNSSTNTPFKAVAFYDDNTIEDVSQKVSWSLELPDGSPYPSGKATINGSIPGILVFTGPILGDSTGVVKATLNGIVGETQLLVATPF